jgi:exodeoxyribonuclease VII large subunit
VPLLFAPARVQGAGAEAEIARALGALGAAGRVDLILLVRGGGSLEDLQPFNSEVVARAIAASPVPVLCGVGHEVDVTIADLVADARAPTPSAAAEQALPDRGSLLASLRRDWRRLVRAAETRLARERAGLAREREALRALSPAARLAARRARFEAAARALARAAAARVDQRGRVLARARALLRAAPQAAARARARLAAAGARLDSLSPLGVLARGYAIVRRARDGAVVRGAGDAAPGEAIAVRVAEAELEAEVARVRPLPPRGSN